MTVKEKVNYVESVFQTIHRQKEITTGCTFFYVGMSWLRDGSKVMAEFILYTKLKFTEVEDEKHPTIKVKHELENSRAAKELIATLVPLYEEALKDEGLTSVETNLNEHTLRYKITFNFEVEETSEEELAKTFKRNAVMVGLSSHIQYGMIFKYKDTEYMLLEINPRARRYPIMARAATGVTYGFTVAFIEDKFS